MQPGFNYEPLTPTAFLHRAAQVFPDRVGVVEGRPQIHLRRVSRAFAEIRGRAEGAWGPPGRSRRPARGKFARDACRALRRAVLPAAVLVALNTRITPADMAFILKHAGASVLIYDHEFATAATRRPADRSERGLRLVCAGGKDDELEALIAAGEPLLASGDRRALAARDQLHERHHRASQGRDVPPPRRLPAGAGHGAAHGARPAIRCTSGRCRCSIATAGASRGR